MSAIVVSSVFIEKVKDMEKLNVSIIHVFSIDIIVVYKIVIIEDFEYTPTRRQTH